MDKKEKRSSKISREETCSKVQETMARSFPLNPRRKNVQKGRYGIKYTGKANKIMAGEFNCIYQHFSH